MSRPLNGARGGGSVLGTYARAIASCQAQASAYGTCVSSRLPEVRRHSHYTCLTPHVLIKCQMDEHMLRDIHKFIVACMDWQCARNAWACSVFSCPLCMTFKHLCQVEQGACSKEFNALQQCFQQVVSCYTSWRFSLLFWWEVAVR